MRRFFVLLALAAFAVVQPASATWSLVQSVNSTACGGIASSNITVSATGSGNLLVLAVVTQVNVTISSVTGGGTWTLCGANCQLTQAGAGSVDGAYLLSSTSGATTIGLTLSGNPLACDAVVFEYAYTAGPISLDVAGTRAQTSANTSIAGVTLSLTGSNDVIVQSIVPSDSAVSISGAYSNPFHIGGNTAGGFAGAINQSSGAAPTWTVNSSTAALMGMAFKESTGGGGGPARRRLITF